MIDTKFILYNVLKSLFHKKYKLFSVVIVFLSFIPIYEITIYKLIVEIVIDSSNNNTLTSSELISLITLVSLLVGISGLTYYFKILRIKFINILSINKQKEQKLKSMTTNWYRASMLEASLISVGLIQIFLISLLTIYLSNLFSIVFLFFIFLALLFAYKKFILEIDNQISFIRKEFTQKRSQSSYKVLSRIKSSESSTLLSSIVMYLVLILDFIALYNDYIDQSQFIAFVFVAKYLGGSFGMLSSSLMRLARSLSYTKKMFAK